MAFRQTLAALLILGSAIVLRADPPQQKRPIRESEINAVIEAIQDEIYDLNLEKDMNLVGKKVTNNPNEVLVNVYFQPDVIENSRSWVIYKLMPEGEIL